MRIFFVDTDFVWPANRGGRIRTLSQLRVLASLPEVERIRLFSLSEEPVSQHDRDALEREIPKLEVLAPVFHPVHLFAHPRYVPRVAWLRAVHGVPYVAGKWDAPTVSRALQRELTERPYAVVWLDGLGSARYLPLVRSLQPRARVVLDQHNVESDRFAQFAKRQHGARRLVADAEWRAARRFERDAMRGVDAVSAISEDDARAYRAMAGIEALAVPQVVPYERRLQGGAPGPRVVYAGQLGWRPNALGLDWLCSAVWPRVRERLPDATLTIAGSGLPHDDHGAPIAPAAWSAPGVTTLGFVPDLEPLYRGSAVMVAPVIGGSGVRIKLLDAFRHGVPVVTTPDGAAGLAIAPGREAFVESAPEAFAERVVEVASDVDLQARLREAGYAFLDRHHHLGAAQAVTRALFARLSLSS
jgi:glycosyltransferase involved in cell wall biosynthesis